MNTMETNEINEMRAQLAVLKKRIENQEIVNDRLLKEAMSRKLSAMSYRALSLCIICAIFIPCGFLTFRNLGMSVPFCIATSGIFAISLVAVALSHYRIRKRDLYAGNLIAVYEEVARMKKIYKNWRYFSIPMVVVWFCWMEYEMYNNIAGQDIYALIGVSMGAIFGGIIGGIFGLRIHKRTLHDADDIQRYIEELRQEQ